MSELWTAALLALWVIVVVLSVLVMGLLRQLGLIQMRLGVDPGLLITDEGLERGVEAPAFEGLDPLLGQVRRSSDFQRSRLVLVFLTPGCLACRELVPYLNDVARGHKPHVEFLTVCSGAGAACQEFAKRFRLECPMILDPTSSIADAFKVAATPFAYLLDERGIVLIRGVANTWTHLESLLREEGTLQAGRGWQPTSIEPKVQRSPEVHVDDVRRSSELSEVTANSTTHA